MRSQRVFRRGSLGFIVCAGYAAPIVDVTLTGGAVVLTARRHGPVPATSGEFSVFGADGALVARGGECEWQAVPAGRELEVPVEITIGEAPASGLLALPRGS